MPLDYVQTLRDKGPAPAAELPRRPGTHGFAGDVRRLQFAGNLSDTPSGGTLTGVYYLEEHDPVAVVRAFCEVNPHFVDAKSRTGFVRQFGRHGSEFKEAARTVADEVGLEGRTPTGDLGTKDGVECPRCGKEFPSLPTHLRDGCDG